jgi:pyruvate decarboxylase
MHLVQLTGWLTFTSMFGKSLVNETLPNVHGVYLGVAADPAQKAFFDFSDLVLCFGPHCSQTNTFRGSSIPQLDATIAIAFTGLTVQVGSEVYRDTPTRDFLQELLNVLDPPRLFKYSEYTKLDRDTSPAPLHHSLPPANYASRVLGKDVVHLSTGRCYSGRGRTASYGSHRFQLPPSTVLFKPVTWLSIGYMLPAILGAAVAQRDLLLRGQANGIAAGAVPSSGRTILFIGDGSFQMITQEISG